MSTHVLYRISPPVSFTHQFEGCTGTIVDSDGTHYTLALRCLPGYTTRVPRSWVVFVDQTPMSAAQARAGVKK